VAVGGGSHDAGVVYRLNVIAPMLTPTADAYVRAGASASTNFGTVSTLLVKKGLSADYTRRSYLTFNVGEVEAFSHATLIKEKIWRREWDSNSWRSFSFCQLHIAHCRRCRKCQRCRGALPAIARTNEFGARQRRSASLGSQNSIRRPGPRFLLTIKNGNTNLQVEFISPAIRRIIVRRQRGTSPPNLRAAASSPNCPPRWRRPDHFRMLRTDRWWSSPLHAMRWRDGCRCRQHGDAVDEQQPPCGAVHA
jgi:hypothetical protein